MTAVYILFAILFFGILIGIHEFGHFITAKACGVKVEEFSIGMGPALWKKQKGETLYALRCIPLGGYCAMTGEDTSSDDPRAFTNQKPWKRILILCAGAFMNFLLGLLIIFFLYLPAKGFYVPVLSDFMEGCPYESADGLQAGDRFYKIDGHRIYQTGDISTFLNRGGDTYDLVLIRNGEKVELKDYPMVTLEYEGQEQKMFGFYLGYGVVEADFGTKLQFTWDKAMEFSRLVWMGLSDLIHGNVEVKELGGPVAIVEVMVETGNQSKPVGEGLENILFLGALIAINLAIMNMLPIPALDGGRVFLLLITWLIESLTRKKLDPKYEGYIHAGGMILLLLLMAYVMINDIFRIFTR
jgi:regulator of sigma E protease